MEKITKREILMGIRALIETGELPEAVTADCVVEYCDREVATLDRRAEKAKERAAAKKTQGDELTEKVAEVLEGAEDAVMTIADIVAAIAETDPEITAGKVQYRLRTLVDAGRVTKEDITIPGGEGSKARKVKGYKMA